MNGHMPLVSKPQKYKSVKAAERSSTIFSHITLAVLSIIWLYPIVWIILNAFRAEYNDQSQLIGIVVSNYIPKRLGLENFTNLFTNTLFPKWFLNTLYVSTFTFIISTFMTLSVAYVMSKLKFRFRRKFLNIAIILGLFPGFMSMIAIYYILKAFNLTQTLEALILCYSAGAGLGFYVAKGFFDIIPNSLVESARLDGANNAQIFGKIILPMSKPIILYTALLSFTGPWMDFIFARVILGVTNRELHTVAVGLYYMIYGEQIDSNLFTTFAAGCVIVAIPIVSLFLFMQRYYVEGVTAGAVKG
ncbi:MAG: sugar ABC transporter permease [Candidatus Izemoplasmatales bacterium]|jgi:arabinogalactan oligomer/maltooligosaccharide transport system permease protein|nr:sugar ABC transporter permease [Candidatus Izemoplasmatales bacterium]